MGGVLVGLNCIMGLAPWERVNNWPKKREYPPLELETKAQLVLDYTDKYRTFFFFFFFYHRWPYLFENDVETHSASIEH